MRNTVGIFGGTFDPIHIGHLRMALELKQHLALNEMRLIPSHKPPHRNSPQATSAQRVEMLRLALSSGSELLLDERELQRDRPSYTYDTLRELRSELGEDVSLVLCVGADAFAGFSTWYRWRDLLTLAHVAVVTRPEVDLPTTGEVADLLRTHRGDVAQLRDSPAGAIVVQSLRLLAISATDIRALISDGQSAQYLVPEAVWQYIQNHQLYS